MARCRNCQKELTPDEIAIYKRMVDRGATDFLCIACFAAEFQVSEELIYEKIRHFKEMGCTLFS